MTEAEHDSLSADYEKLFADFIQYKKDVRAAAMVACEEAFRRGYLRGYFTATDDVEHLIVGGFSRPQEIHNILNDHAKKLPAWRYAEEGAKETPPPKLELLNWSALKQQVRKRDGNVCQQCHSTKEPEVDHIVGVHEGGFASLENLRVLCKTCNRARPRGRWFVR